MLRIITDSGADITQEEAEALGITLMPMTVSFGNETWRAGVDLPPRTFFEKLIESDTLPSTSMIPPMTYGKVFRKVRDAGDEAVVICLSSVLSGTCQSAMLAAADFPCVHVVDSLNACIGQRILVMRALELRSAGLTAEALVARLEEEKKRIRLLAVLDTLEYLKKGGRISAATAMAGSLLSIKPVISVINGAVCMVGKARGSKNANNLLRGMTAENEADTSMPACMGYSGLTDTLLRKYIEDNREVWKDEAVPPIVQIGPVIGTHVGPGAIALAFFAKG